MNNLFKYRLILIKGQLCLLLANQLWSFWLGEQVVVWLLCGGYLSLIIGLQISHPKAQQSRSMVVIDLLLWAGYFYFLGGVSNPLIWCLLIPSVLSALSQSVPFTWLVTLIANGLYLLLWSLTSESQGQHSMHDDMLQQHIMGMWLGFIAVSVLLTWVTTTLMQRINNGNQSLLTFEKQRQADENLIKMATLATSTAHELGTPLASIKLLVDDLKLTLDSAELEQDFLLLDAQIMRCKKVLEELTALTAKDRLDDSHVMSVNKFIENLLQSIETNAPEVKFNFNSDLSVEINADTSLHLACTNVLNNSVAAGAKNIDIDLTEQGDVVCVSIEDDGQGLAHHNKTGMGIGLKLSTRILESMGGGLSIDVAKTGAKTLLRLPVSSSPIKISQHRRQITP